MAPEQTTEAQENESEEEETRSLNASTADPSLDLEEPFGWLGEEIKEDFFELGEEEPKLELRGPVPREAPCLAWGQRLEWPLRRENTELKKRFCAFEIEEDQTREGLSRNSQKRKKIKGGEVKERSLGNWIKRESGNNGGDAAKGPMCYEMMN